MLKHVCDVCGKTKELDDSDASIVKDYTGTPIGTVLATCPHDWQVIQILSPLSKSQREELTKRDRRHRPTQPITPHSWIKTVCSVTCGEKALDEAKEYLRRAFEEIEIGG